jgi:hypothetical protein
MSRFSRKKLYLGFQAYISPKYDENLPGTNKTVSSITDSYESSGGFTPDWECNKPAPSPTPTPTPTPTPIAGDFTDTDDTDGDQVNLADYLVFKSGFGTTYTIFDYNSLVTNFGK